MKCFELIPKKICTEYTTWFEKCEEEIDYLTLETHNVILE